MSALWRYKAVPMRPGEDRRSVPLGARTGLRSAQSTERLPGDTGNPLQRLRRRLSRKQEGSAVRSGELAADSAASARAALRRVGLMPLEVRPAHRRIAAGIVNLRLPLAETARAHQRRRRSPLKAELFDGLATMLESGLPLLEALDALTGAHGHSGAARSLLAGLRQRLRDGESLGGAMGSVPGAAGWFDSAEAAMVRAGERGGTLPAVLRAMADDQQRAEQLSGRLIGALAYPLLVVAAGLLVALLLSTRTLPPLLAILADAGVEAPGLTTSLVTAGGWFAAWWWAPAPALVLGTSLAALIGRAAQRRGGAGAGRAARFVPRAARGLAAARIATGLSRLLRSGVPAVESLRVLAPTIRGPGASAARRRLLDAAQRVERGESLAAALDDPVWFDAEFRRLVAAGEASGELDTLLERLGLRYERAARRLIDRLSAMLEPAAILLLAVFVGLVVMAAVLPLIRLQEVL